jgi:seryl-tRNA synthetase
LPGFIPLAYLQQLGSFEQYPHHLYFPSPLVADLERIEAFQQAAGSEVEVGAYLSAPAYCLKASACAPLYPTIKNKEFQAYAYYTMLGACTRHEALNTTSFERLTEFQMREIVYIGDSDGDHDFRRFALGLCQNLIECFDLPAQITTANDSFFISNYSRFKLMQLLGHDKFEAKVLIADTGAEVAFGSLNHHRNFFGKRFGFRYRGETATSACVGFGLERLAYGILCRHGLQESRVFSMLDHLQARYDLIAQA